MGNCKELNRKSKRTVVDGNSVQIVIAKIYAIAIHETAGLKTALDVALFAIFMVNPVLVTDE